MCGIAGILKFDGGPVGADTLHSMLRVLRHRGPDASAVHVKDNIGLGHARLSIIDLKAGAQPMSIEDQTLWITFNGEIFNYIELREDLIRRGHRFRTQSDTEVVLRLYLEKGEKCVEDLNGQWAFAIWDSREKKLFLSRDRMGVRPLFYTESNGEFIFASEIKAIFQNPSVTRRLDLKALDQIFTFWVTLPPRTAFEGVSQLPPGHSMTIREGKKSITKFWEPRYELSPANMLHHADDAAEELLSLLEDATRIRLRADVSVGAYVSGGIDSTFIAALIRRVASNRLRTFSVSFEVPDYDETSYQTEASRFLGTDHSQILCSNRHIAEALPDVVWHAEQPILRTAPAPLYLLSKLVRDSNFKVVLTGEGSDEVFGGYDIFKEAKIRRFWAQQPDSKIRPTLLRRLYPYLENIQRQPRAYLQSFFRVKPGDVGSPLFSHLPRWQLTSRIKLFFSEEVKQRLLGYDILADLESQLTEDFSRWNPFCQAQYLETALLLPGYILSSQGDRVAMAHSVEGRYPFLDHRVVEFAARLHPNLKMHVLQEKHILKLAARNKIPESILRRPKQPYRAPAGQMFSAEAPCQDLREALNSSKLAEFGVFDPSAVQKLVDKLSAAGTTTATRDDMAILGILSTQLLLDRFACTA